MIWCVLLPCSSPNIVLISGILWMMYSDFSMSGSCDVSDIQTSHSPLFVWTLIPCLASRSQPTAGCRFQRRGSSITVMRSSPFTMRPMRIGKLIEMTASRWTSSLSPRPLLVASAPSSTTKPSSVFGFSLWCDSMEECSLSFTWLDVGDNNC